MGSIRHWKPAVLLLAALLMVLAGMIAAQRLPGKKPSPELVYPVIKDFGGVALRNDDNTDVPKPDKDYRVIFDIVSKSDNVSEVNPGLKRIARTINLFAASGVNPDHLEFVANLHSAATRSIVNDRTYREWFGVSNPNIKLIGELEDAGVKMEVCGQVLSHWHVRKDQINPQVAITPSSLTTLAIYGKRGYAYERL